MGASCLIFQYIDKDGKHKSKLYSALTKKIGDRSIANYIYAYYITLDIASLMDAKGYNRERVPNADSSLWQHNVDAVLDYLNFNGFLDAQTDKGQILKKEGIIDSTGERVIMNAETALKKANDLNSKYNSLAATVMPANQAVPGTSERGYIVIANVKNSENFNRQALMDNLSQLWDSTQQLFLNDGIDISTFSDNAKYLFNAVSFYDNIKQLASYKQIPMQYLAPLTLELLLNMFGNTSLVQRLMRKFGDYPTIALNMYEVLHNIDNALTDAEKSLVRATAANMGNFGSVGANTLRSIFDSILKKGEDLNLSYNDIFYSDMTETIDDIKRLFGEGKDVNELGVSITTIKEAAQKALVTLSRLIKLMEEKLGVTDESKRLRLIRSLIDLEIQSKRYTSGIISFMLEASQEIEAVLSSLDSKVDLGADLSLQISLLSECISSLQDLKSKYNDIVDFLSNLSVENANETLLLLDINNIKQIANPLKSRLQEIERLLRADSPNYKNPNLVTKLAMKVALAHTPDNFSLGSIKDLVEMQLAEVSMWDKFYDMGSSSNPMIAMLGGMIRDALENASTQYTDIRNRVRDAYAKLIKAGEKDDSWMTDDKGHIISNIDWSAYSEVKLDFIKDLRRQKITGVEFKEALREWEENNTIEEPVDIAPDGTVRRFERLPDDRYRWGDKDPDNPLSHLNAALMEYYKTMMQLKAELDTKLPDYARKHFRAPLIRAKDRTLLWDAVKTLDIKKLGSIFHLWMKDFVLFREDDPTRLKNAVFEDDENFFLNEQGNYDNTVMKRIPIFFVKRLSNPKDIDRRFSYTIEKFALTALNYEAMHSVEKTALSMRDFIANQRGRALIRGNQEKEVIDAKTLLTLRLYKTGSATGAGELLDAYINKFIYGIHSDQNAPVWAMKFVNGLTKISSLVGISLNALGGWANYIVAEYLTFLRATGGHYFNVKDYAAASAYIFGKTGGGIIEEGFRNFSQSEAYRVHTFDQALCEFMDPEHENLLKTDNFYNNFWQRITFNPLYKFYEIGEALGHRHVMYAMLIHKKVYTASKKEISLLDALERKDLTIGFKEKVFDKDGNELDTKYLQEVRKEIRFVNQECHGAMNEEDKGVIYQKFYAKLFMNFRQWMVRTAASRFRGKHIDVAANKEVEGFYRTAARFAKDAAKNLNNVNAVWNELSSEEKANVRQAVVETIVALAIELMLNFSLVPPEEEDEFYSAAMHYTLIRLARDIETTHPVGAIFTAANLFKSPIPALKIIDNSLYIVSGLGDINKLYKRKDRKYWVTITNPLTGEKITTVKNKYAATLLRYWAPGLKDWNNLQSLGKDDRVFKSLQFYTRRGS